MARQISLVKVIGRDLAKRSKLAILFFFGIVISITMTILVTNETRILRNQLEHNLVEKKALDIEWHKLILEENTLGEQQRIERIAKATLKMEHILPENELILMIPMSQSSSRE